MADYANSTADEWRALLRAAREGDESALGQICERLRQYLLLMAENDLGDDLRAKLGASDVVQQTMLEACRDFDSFRGGTEEEFRVWIKRLVQHNLVDTARSFRQTQRRDIARDRPIDDGENRREPVASGRSASSIVSRRETDEELLRAVARLPAGQREILELRHRRGLSYAEIASRINMSEVAARKLWSRTVAALREELSAGDEPRTHQES